MVEGRFKEIKVDIRRGDPKMRSLKTTKIYLNGVQVAPFGLKLCQNDAPDLRIILEASPDQKTIQKCKKSRFSGRRHEAEPGKSAAVRMYR